MAQKTRIQLVSDSDSTFLDNNTGQIIPANHRTFNDDLIDSVATQLDDNQFDGNCGFSQTITSQQTGDAFYASQGSIHLEDGTFQNDNGDLNIGGHSDLNTAFVRVLQNCFATNSINVPSIGGVLNLTNIDGNIIYLSGDGEINTWNGVIGTIFYAIHSGNVVWNVIGGDVEPQNNMQMYGNDILIFMFTSSTTIRIMGVHRAYNSGYGVGDMGQNYFTLTNSSDAITLQSNSLLDTGAVYRVKDAYYNAAKGILFDVVLTAKNNNTFSENCILIYEPLSACYNAIFFGAFNIGSILIYGGTDYRLPYSFIEAETNDFSSQLFATGAKSFIEDNNLPYYGFAQYDLINVKPQKRNLQDLSDRTLMPFGSIFFDSINNIDKFIRHDGDTSEPSWGINWPNGAPSLGDMNTFNSNQGLTTQFDSYTCRYSVVNNMVIVYFKADIQSKQAYGLSGHEVQTYLPLPFSEYDGSGFGNGTCRNNDDNNQHDIALMTNYEVGVNNYFLVGAKYQQATNNTQSYTIQGSYMYRIL